MEKNSFRTLCRKLKCNQYNSNIMLGCCCHFSDKAFPKLLKGPDGLFCYTIKKNDAMTLISQIPVSNVFNLF